MKSMKKFLKLKHLGIVVIVVVTLAVSYIVYNIDDATVPSTAKGLPVATELPDGPMFPAFNLILPKASELSENERLSLETARDLFAILTTTGDGKTLTKQAQTTLTRIANQPGYTRTSQFQFQNSPRPRWIRFDNSYGTAITFHLDDVSLCPTRIWITAPQVLGSNFLEASFFQNGRINQMIVTTKPRTVFGYPVMPALLSAKQWSAKGELIREESYDPAKKMKLMKDENHEISTL